MNYLYFQISQPVDHSKILSVLHRAYELRQSAPHSYKQDEADGIIYVLSLMGLNKDLNEYYTLRKSEEAAAKANK